MMENTIRFLVNREFIVINLSELASFYGSFFIDDIFKKTETEPLTLGGCELGDFDLHGKMSYTATTLEKLKMTYLDEKAILFQSPEQAVSFKNLLTPGLIHSEQMAEADDEDWFGEKLFYGAYGRTPISLKAGISEWNSPALLRTFLKEAHSLKNVIISTGGCLFDALRDKKIIDLGRTPENHLFVEDETNLLLGSGLSPYTAREVLRGQYPSLDVVFDGIEEPYLHSSSLWDICCFHPSGGVLINTFLELNAIVSVHNGAEAKNISPALLNKLTPGLPLYFLIIKKS